MSKPTSLAEYRARLRKRARPLGLFVEMRDGLVWLSNGVHEVGLKPQWAIKLGERLIRAGRILEARERLDDFEEVERG